jgi:hypothetical protein
MSRRLEKAPSTPPRKESKEELLDMLNSIVVGEIIFAQKPLETITLEDIRSVLGKIQSYEFSAPFSPLGDLENLAERIQPAVEEKIRQILTESERARSSAVSSAKSLSPEQIFFTGNEFGMNPQRTGKEKRPGITAARQRLMEEYLKMKRKEN